MIIEYYDTYEYREQLLLLMDSDSKLQFLAAATFLGGHSLIVTLYCGGFHTNLLLEPYWFGRSFLM